ncbi:Uncharacterised protein [Anaerotruncus sp. 2789STDY5834896]|uniref:Uncharacterized protein n=1 Tax=uncultured Anaerotruncus sp. TaxID=905011 RepID=A0A1C6I673_9FIRM|nr:Uncharacterised protein [uncultured Anaerotruncus sp.]
MRCTQSCFDSPDGHELSTGAALFCGVTVLKIDKDVWHWTPIMAAISIVC